MKIVAYFFLIACLHGVENNALCADIVKTILGNDNWSGVSIKGGPGTNSSILGVSTSFCVDDTGNVYYISIDNNNFNSITGKPIENPIDSILVKVLPDGNVRSLPLPQGTVVHSRSCALDRRGNLYFSHYFETTETHRNSIMKMDLTSDPIKISLVAGTDDLGAYNDGDAANASFNGPSGIAFDDNGNLYIADKYNHRIRYLNISTGVVTTVAGIERATNDTDTTSIGDEGPALTAKLYYPTDLALDSAGNIYILDSGNGRIRKIDKLSGIITTVAGNGEYGFSGDGGPAINARLAFSFRVSGFPGLAIDSKDNIYISDCVNSRIRKVSSDSDGLITTIAGGGTGGDGSPARSAQLSFPTDLRLGPNDELIFFDNTRIKQIATGQITDPDTDGDSFTDKFEAVAGTDSINPSSPLQSGVIKPGVYDQYLFTMIADKKKQTFKLSLTCLVYPIGDDTPFSKDIAGSIAVLKIGDMLTFLPNRNKVRSNSNMKSKTLFTYKTVDPKVVGNGFASIAIKMSGKGIPPIFGNSGLPTNSGGENVSGLVAIQTTLFINDTSYNFGDLLFGVASNERFTITYGTFPSQHNNPRFSALFARKLLNGLVGRD